MSTARAAREPARGEPILEARDLRKVYRGVPALDGVSLSLRIGEVLGLAGHNGAGKSTLLNILSGTVKPDGGTMTRSGKPYTPGSYAGAVDRGVIRIFQELSIIENLTVGENLTFGNESRVRKAGFVTRKHSAQIADAFLQEVGLGDLHAAAPAGTLSLAERQLLEIAKALYMARIRNIAEPVLLLDEPTSGLTASQVAFLESHLNRIRSLMGVVLTTHRGAELLNWSDRILVLRDGRAVGEPDPHSTGPAELAALMLGDAETATLSRAERPAAPKRVLDVEGLLVPGLAEPIDLTLDTGEVLAIVSPAEEKGRIARAVAGLLKPLAGEVRVEGHRLQGGPVDAVGHGVRFVPTDRAGEGLSLLHPVRWNLSVAAIAEGRRRLARNRKEEAVHAQALIRDFGVKVASDDQPADSLSGGNQQKLLVARALAGQGRLLVLESPTRGIDVHAKTAIFGFVRDAAASGVAVLIVTDEPEEVVPVCDRLIMLRDGAVSGQFDCRVQEPTLAELEEALV
ncbi:sugar ABC transporter ATP-binding protein [Amnibacterium sp. CER49]|uniref:sugar ABC transporter ATP-binding protein n=1 Tax=Amnibacterium sp. CER49 TaxID=3039161 RepID=UPI00244B2D3F|nr:sugar ABC transporter ATP-binding protein [Amnibacterium sp. CER49]MDH2442929.1 sugar ABC transporter ATP-binding protein [Amnibacterium sp. CER49]